MGSLTETVDVKFKPLSEKSFNLIKELLETRVSCVTALSNLEDGQDINFHELHTILLHSSQFAYLLKAFLAINPLLLSTKMVGGGINSNKLLQLM